MSINEIANVKVDIDGQEAGRRMEKLTEQTKAWKKELREIEKSNKPVDPAYYNNLKKKVKEGNRELRSYKKQLTDVNYVVKNLSKVSYEDLKKAQRRLNIEVRKASRATAEERIQLQKKKTQLSLITAEMQRTTAVSKSTGFSMGKMGDGFNRYFGMLTAFVGSLVGVVMGFRQISDMSMEFEERVDNLGALTGLAGDELAWLEENAKSSSTAIVEGGVRIKQGATDIVDAYTMMGSQRPELLKNKEALAAVTQDGIILSEAAKGKLEPAIGALANTMNQFNLQADQSRRIINVLAAGSKEGAANIPYLSDAIEKSGTTFELMGVQVENAVGIIEAIAPKFKRAEMAGNGLDKVLLKMKDKMIGYASGTFDMNDAIDELIYRFQNGESASELFGVEHAKMVEVLIQSKDEINRYTEAVTGTNMALEQARKNTNNRAAELAQSRNEYKLTAMALGEELGPAIIMSTNGFTYFMKALIGGMKFYQEHRAEIKAITTGLIMYGIAIKADLILTKAFAVATWIAQKAMVAFNVATKSNPIALLIGALVAAASYFLVFKDSAKEATDEQSAFNDELERTMAITGQKLYDDLKAQHLDYQNWAKSANRSDLESVKNYLITRVEDINRQMANMGENAKPWMKEHFKKERKAIQDEISIIENEFKKFKKNTSGGYKTIEAPEANILDGQRALVELENYLKEIEKLKDSAKDPIQDDEGYIDEPALEYALQKYEESFAGRRATLESFYASGVIGKQEYNDKIKLLDEEMQEHDAQTLADKWDKIQSKFEKIIAFAQQLAGILQTWANVQSENDKLELSNYEDGIDKKRDLYKQQLDDDLMSKKSYDASINELDQKVDKKSRDLANKKAKRDKEMAIFNAIISTAAGIAAALPVIPLAIIAGAMGAIQVGLIASQKVPQYAAGNYNDVIGATDGKSYQAKQGSYGTQITDGPTLIPGIGLVGEGHKPQELIFSGEDTTRIMNSPRLVEAINYTISQPQFADGNYPAQASNTTNYNMSTSNLESIMLQILEENKKQKPAIMSWQSFLDKQEEYNDLMNEVTASQ